MNSNTLPVGRIFGQDRRLIVPLFQRPYVWQQEEQWEPLWNDVLDVTERWNGDKRKPHFLGAIVLDAQRKPIGHLETRLIIDGQQRLTTLQMMYESFCDICAEAKVDRHHRALLKLTRNDDPMSDDEDDVYKVWPTTADQEHFRNVMKASSAAEVLKAYGKPAAAKEVGQRLVDCYLFFHREIRDWLKPGEKGFEDRVKVLYEVLREGLRIVAIDLEDEDDPQVIFESLNARGTPLLPADLVKNYLFYKVANEGHQMQPLYDQYWRAFDEDDKYWREELGRGHARRARIDLFLHNYLTARKLDEVSTSHLYTVFREHASASAAADQLKTLRQYADTYRNLDHLSEKSRERLFVERLRTMEIVTAFPFVLELFVSRGADMEDVRAALADLESFLVRRMVCGLNTRGYGRLFVDMLSTLKGKGAAAPKVRKFLLTSSAESSRWPDDKEFRKAWLTVPVYRTLARARVRMLLEAVERQMRTSKADLDFGTLSIEHLLPCEWQEHWPLPKGVEPFAAAAQREAALHSLGNLALVTQPLNSALSNGPWKAKLREILKHSALAINRDLDQFPAWDEAAIEKRGKQLCGTAIAVWSCPASA